MEVHIDAVEWGAAVRAVSPGSPPGDGWLALPAGPVVLLAALDALGHGREAADAAEAARAALARDPLQPIERLISRCDDALRGTRGVTLGLASIRIADAAMTWAGVGNVHGIVLRANTGAQPRRVAMLQRPGVVGRRLPALATEQVALEPNDRVVFATDGVASDFVDDATSIGPPQAMAERLLERHFLGVDDGLVLVAGIRGGNA